MNLVFAAATGQFPEAMRDAQTRIATAATGAIRELADNVRRDGRANIAAAGFSKRWQTGFGVTVRPKTGVSIDAAAVVRHKLSFIGIFEYGGAISGRPLLWIPLDSTPKKIGGRRMTPRLYTEQIGPLFRITRPGRAPLLAATVAGQRRGGRRATVAQLRSGAKQAAGFGGRRRAKLSALPLFVGVPRVKIRKRLNILPIYDKAIAGLAASYLRHLPPEA